jgi:hypothetical protein
MVAGSRNRSARGRLGPPRQSRPEASYATAYVAFTLIEGGVKPSDARMKRVLDWLRARQDQTFGYWDAASINKRFEPGSMQEQFMRDAATASAVAALAKAESAGR